MAEYFGVFGGGGDGESPFELVAYYEEWGWIDFLSEVARTKVYDIAGSGLDSIECAKNASAYKVLTEASKDNYKNKAMRAAYKLKD